MTYLLRKSGYTTFLIHQSKRGDSTPVSSGIINPVTGMRFVKTWNYEKIMPIVKSIYSEIEMAYDTKFMHYHDMIVEFKSIEEENNWQLRMAELEYAAYCKLFDSSSSNDFVLQKEKQYGLIENVMRVDISKICNKIIQKLQDENLCIEEEFDHSKLEVKDEFIQYKNSHTFHKVIFCEGHLVNNNPFFSWLPIIKLKGERILFDAKPTNQKILHSNYSIIPIHNQFWVGANYSLTDKNYVITAEETDNLNNFTASNLASSHLFSNQDFGFRPSSRDRRPIIGAHPKYPNLLIFNGMGTKGASLAPYCADFLLKHFIHKDPIPDEISIKRFVKKMT